MSIAKATSVPTPKPNKGAPQAISSLGRQDRESKQAVVEQQITAAITARNLRGNEIALMFDAFKEWIEDTKGMAYEEWAQTNPNVAESYQEFNT